MTPGRVDFEECACCGRVSCSCKLETRTRDDSSAYLWCDDHDREVGE